VETLWAPPSWWAGGALGAAAVWLVLAAATPAAVALAGALTTAERSWPAPHIFLCVGAVR
jgi:hypothetical protein